MTTKSPRIYVTLDPSDAEIIQILSHNEEMSMSAIIKKMVEKCIEEHEDYLLAKRADEAEKKWIEGGRKTISHEELCKNLGL